MPQKNSNSIKQALNGLDKMFNSDAWNAALGRCCEQPDVVPPGWYTRQQLQVNWRKSATQAKANLSLLVRANKVEIKKFRILCTDGKSQPIPHYRLRG